MAAGNVPYNVVSQYETLLNGLSDAAAAADCGLVRWQDPLREQFKREGNGVITFDCLIHLNNWKARAQELIMLIHVQERIKTNPDVSLEKSIVRLNYYKEDNGSSQLLQSIHFDYGPPSARHPVFHAQFTNELIQLTEQEAAGIEFALPRTGGAECFKEARIPTSDMTLPSVLLCLAADHFKHVAFLEFLERVTALQEKMPQPNFARTRQSLGAESHHLRSSHWFAHEV